MKKADRIISLILIAFGAFILFTARGLPPAPMKGTPGPAYFPTFLCALLILCGLVLLGKSFGRKGEEKVTFEPHSGARLWGTFLLATGTPAGLAYLGFAATCFGSSLIFFLVLRVRMASALLLSSFLTAGIYLVFHHGLQVQLPTGVF
jgi:hypothetical protein